jgi:hypothetical protein
VSLLQELIMPLKFDQPLIPLRGPSGKLYGEFDVARGVIIFKRGKGRGAGAEERVDLTPYLKAANVKKEEYQG